MEKQKKNFLFWGVIILIVCVLIIVLVMQTIKLKNNNQVESGEQPILSGDTDEFKVNIKPEECLSKDKINELLDLGEFKDNEMMVYKIDNGEHFIEVWKMKLEAEQDVMEAYTLFNTRQQKLYDSYSGDKYKQESVLYRRNNKLSCGGRVVTFIVSNHLEEVQNQTQNWLKD